MIKIKSQTRLHNIKHGVLYARKCTHIIYNITYKPPFVRCIALRCTVGRNR